MTPSRVPSPSLIRFNEVLARELGFDPGDVAESRCADIFSGNVIPEGASPVAMAYTGHQFGHFNPQLGDGRALLYGDIDRSDGGIHQIHLKGTGQTPFSRNGDGKAALGPVLREYLVSEAMHALGVPTTRALACVATGEEVIRERLLPGGVITRVARSFVRVGTFEYFMARNDLPSLRRLADFCIDSVYPDLAGRSDRYSSLLRKVVERQAELIAMWMQIGFIHGVMNTDNMSIAGETIDYGPCAFMDHFAFQRVYSSIDRHGRYAYDQQASIGLWNLTRLAESLLPLIAEQEADDDVDASVEVARTILQDYQPGYEQAWLRGMAGKLGIRSPVEADRELIDSLLELMARNETDFTLTFRILGSYLQDRRGMLTELRAWFDEDESVDHWLERWQSRLSDEAGDDDHRLDLMGIRNPLYIPRNHLVEQAIRAAEDEADFSVFHELLQVVQNPFEHQEGREEYSRPPEVHEIVHQTFCGT